MEVDPTEWLAQAMPLPNPDRAEITNFVLLWGIYEGIVHGPVSANAQKIEAAVVSLKSKNKLSLDRLGPEIRYFQERYFDGAKPTYEFRKLHFRPSDRSELVEKFVRDNTKDEAEILSAMLIIIFRLRCNLFHGTKAISGMKDELENFRHANTTLVAVIEMESPNYLQEVHLYYGL